MIILKTEKVIAVFAFLFFALFAITECKRGGGGGRIFRATVLKERRNSRRPRDVQQQENKPHLTDSVLISNKLLDEVFEIQTPKIENWEDHHSLLSSIDEQSDYSTSEQNTPNVWQDATNDKDGGSQIRNTKANIREGDEVYDYHAHDYFNDEVQKIQHLPNHRPSKYDQSINTGKTNIEHYYKSMEKEGSDETKNYNNKIAYILLNHLFKGKKFIKTHLASSKSIGGNSEWNISKKPKLSMWDIVFSRYPYYLYSSKQTAIVPCQKDFSPVCPHNTTPLCTNKGKVLCTVFKPQNMICDEESHSKCIERSIETCLENLQDILKDNEKRTLSVIKVPHVADTIIIAEQNNLEDKSVVCVARVVLFQSIKENNEKFVSEEDA